MASELKEDKIQVADMFTTASAIRPQWADRAGGSRSRLILPQNVIPLVRSEVADNATATAALEAVQAALTTEDCRRSTTRWTSTTWIPTRSPPNG